jgi:hypothetical protein
VTVQERIALAIEAEANGVHARRQDHESDDRTGGYLVGLENGLLDAARIARETPDDIAGELGRCIDAAFDREMKKIFPGGVGGGLIVVRG